MGDIKIETRSEGEVDGGRLGCGLSVLNDCVVK